MPRKAPAAIEEDEGPSKAWLESYADAMTLLLAFFIMMFAFALVDESKFFDFKVGMVTALGTPTPITDHTDSILGEGQGIAPTLGDDMVPADDIEQGGNPVIEIGRAADGTVTKENAEEVRQEIERAFEAIGASDYVDVEVDQRGVVIRFDDRILFASGSSDLGADAPVILEAAALVASTVDNPVNVEGHTDNVPTNPRSHYPSNWELSGARASSVVRYMLQSATMAPSRFTAMGLADTAPRETNDTEAGRQANRRVEVVLRIQDLDSPDLALVDPINVLEDPTDSQTTAETSPTPSEAEAEGGLDIEPGS